MRSNNRRFVDSIDRLPLLSFLFQPELCSVCNNTGFSGNVICEIVLLELYSNIFLYTLGNRLFISATFLLVFVRMFWNIRIPEIRVANKLSMVV